jgi:lysophospholipase L1-like esterase
MNHRKICIFLFLPVLWVPTVGCGESQGDGGTATEDTAELCHDDADNDGDGSTDCEDVQCTAFCHDTETEILLEWRTTWVSSQQLTESNNLPPDPGLSGNTLRQVIQISVGGETARFTFSNEYGDDPLTIVAAAAANSEGGGDIDTDTHTPLTFAGESSVTIAKGKTVTSDPIEWTLTPFSNLAVTMLFDDAPPTRVTGHPGSRTTSYLAEGDTVADESMTGSTTEHWYFLSQVDVETAPTTASVVTLGDSITDGRGSTTNGNDRWPNDLSHRLLDNDTTSNTAVLNQGVGGNCLTRTCLGPSGESRFERDGLKPLGVKWVIILEGINDLNSGSSTDDLIESFTAISDSAREARVEVIGGTIMPCEGNSYFDEELETARQEINDWIRTTDKFDAVIDFDEITRDPSSPTRLAPEIDGGDGLHPSAAGYQIMADAIDLTLFEMGADTNNFVGLRNPPAD